MGLVTGRGEALPDTHDLYGLKESKDGDSVLGKVPHQIRGFLRDWKHILIVGQAYDKCTACSKQIVEAYREGSWEFVSQMLQDPSRMESLLGLDQLQTEEDIDWDSS